MSYIYTSILDGFPCPDCQGTGELVEIVVCFTCGDDGREYCWDCDDDGYITYVEACPTCDGRGVVAELPFEVNPELQPALINV